MQRFSELFFEAMDDALREVFGESVHYLIYRSVETRASLKREEFGEKIEVFYAHLEKLLGSESAQIIQATSLKRLCLKLQREYEEVEKYFSVLDELYEIKFRLLAPSLKEERSACN